MDKRIDLKIRNIDVMEFLWKRRKLRSRDINWQNSKLDSRLIRPLAKIELRAEIGERGPLESEKGWGGVDISGGSWKLVERGKMEISFASTASDTLKE